MDNLNRTVEAVEKCMKKLCKMIPSKAEEFTLMDSRYMHTISKVYELYLEMEEHRDNYEVVGEKANLIISSVEMFESDVNTDEP